MRYWYLITPLTSIHSPLELLISRIQIQIIKQIQTPNIKKTEFTLLRDFFQWPLWSCLFFCFFSADLFNMGITLILMEVMVLMLTGADSVPASDALFKSGNWGNSLSPPLMLGLKAGKWGSSPSLMANHICIKMSDVNIQRVHFKALELSWQLCSLSCNDLQWTWFMVNFHRSWS